MAAPGKPRAATKPALSPDALIATSKAGRIRLIEKRLPRPKKQPAPSRQATT
jgi:hypothetical protein